MKIILTGSTGFIGSEVLRQCLANPTITSVLVLSRRALPIEHAKLRVFVIRDFLKLEAVEGLVEELRGANACIWAMGTTAAVPVLEIDYPLAFVDVLLKGLRTQERKRFRYVHVSGKYVESDQDKKLWFGEEKRKVKGLADTKLLHVAEQNKDIWETYMPRPDLVLSRNSYLARMASLLIGSNQIWVDDCAAALIDIALNGAGELIIANAELVRRGKTTVH